MGTIPELPIPISLISGQYFLFSIDAVTYLRREHNICGVLVGTLPQIPQQNVFLSLPLELMPEEAQLLVEKEVAYIVDDAEVHRHGIKAVAEEDRRRYLNSLEQEGRQAAIVNASRKDQKREQRLKNLEKSKSPRAGPSGGAANVTQDGNEEGSEETLFQSASSSKDDSASSRASLASDSVFGVTPATSHALFPKTPALITTKLLPQVPSSYPLFAHLHSKGYFLSPGLRFGCQYMAYPGDQLRFHSHFLVASAEWEEEIDLMDLVAGGRLGTGVKKGYLIGGKETSDDEEASDNSQGSVRTFSLEWAGM